MENYDEGLKAQKAPMQVQPLNSSRYERSAAKRTRVTKDEDQNERGVALHQSRSLRAQTEQRRHTIAVKEPAYPAKMAMQSRSMRRRTTHGAAHKE